MYHSYQSMDPSHNFFLQHLKTLTGHTGGVWCSQFEGNTIVSGSTDRSLRVSYIVYSTCACVYNINFVYVCNIHFRCGTLILVNVSMCSMVIHLLSGVQQCMVILVSWCCKIVISHQKLAILINITVHTVLYKYPFYLHTCTTQVHIT